MNLFYFLNGFHQLLNHNLNLIIIDFPCFVQIAHVFIKFLKFRLEKLLTKIPCFPCAVATLV